MTFDIYHRIDRDRFFFDEKLTKENLDVSHVYMGDVEASDLDEVFEIMNINHPWNIRIRAQEIKAHTSSSVGDVFIERDSEKAFQIDSVGFVELKEK